MTSYTKYHKAYNEKKKEERRWNKFKYEEKKIIKKTIDEKIKKLEEEYYKEEPNNVTDYLEYMRNNNKIMEEILKLKNIYLSINLEE